MEILYSYKNDVRKMCKELDKYDMRKVALMCLERQFRAYEQFAYKREWNRREEYRELLNECWQAILQDAILEEEVWEKHEEIKPEFVNNKPEEYKLIEFAYANIFASNVETFLEMLLDDENGEESFLLYNIEFIINYIHEANLDLTEDVSEKLIEKEKENQIKDILVQKKIINMDDVKNWCLQMKSLVCI